MNHKTLCQMGQKPHLFACDKPINFFSTVGTMLAQFFAQDSLGAKRLIYTDTFGLINASSDVTVSKNVIYYNLYVDLH